MRTVVRSPDVANGVLEDLNDAALVPLNWQVDKNSLFNPSRMEMRIIVSAGVTSGSRAMSVRARPL